MDKLTVNIINRSPHPMPEYKTPSSAGMDIRAWTEHTIDIKPMQRVMVRTGIYIEMPEGIECQVRPRSGLAVNKGITVLNTPGTIDADYRGEICVVLSTSALKPSTSETASASHSWCSPNMRG